MGQEDGNEGDESDEGDEGQEGDESEQGRKGQEGLIGGVPRQQGENSRRSDEGQGGLEEGLARVKEEVCRQWGTEMGQGLLAGTEGARHQRLRGHWRQERTGQSVVRKGEGDLQGMSREGPAVRDRSIWCFF